VKRAGRLEVEGGTVIAVLNRLVEFVECHAAWRPPQRTFSKRASCWASPRFRLTIEGNTMMDNRIGDRPAFRLIGHAARVPLIQP
jgi:hypothetical protein